jgi:hypothetical protein
MITKRTLLGLPVAMLVPWEDHPGFSDHETRVVFLKPGHVTAAPPVLSVQGALRASKLAEMDECQRLKREAGSTTICDACEATRKRWLI